MLMVFGTVGFLGGRRSLYISNESMKLMDTLSMMNDAYMLYIVICAIHPDSTFILLVVIQLCILLDWSNIILRHTVITRH